VPLPVFDQNRGNIAQADAAFQTAKLAEVSLRTQIRSDLWKALQEWRAAASGLLGAYEGGVVAEAKESLEITRHSFELGTSTLLDFLDAEASYRQIESAYRASLARAILAAQNIRFTVGEEEP
jgi:cobalt-zinc-cadmium efflux system outer membrane protein